MKKPEFIGRKYSAEEKSKADDALKTWAKESREPIEGELEKTDEEIKIIKTANSLIEKEFKFLGLESYKPISFEQVHILSAEVFKSKFPDFDGLAFFRSTLDAVYVNKDRIDNKARALSRILHELIHRASTQRFYADRESNVYDARVGYRIRSPWKGPEREDRLRGFNELMNDYTTHAVLLKNVDALDDLGISHEDIQGPIYNYMRYGSILEAIIKKISLKKGITQQQAFLDMERGQFQSFILNLKDIEHAFGKGSLEILSYLGVVKDKERMEKLDTMIEEFFVENDEGKRSEIGIKIHELFENAKSEPPTETGQMVSG